MRLIIIGNGFDISHKLNTRFSNFKDYILKEYSDGERWVDLFEFYSNIDSYWSDFEKALSELDETIVLENNREYLLSYNAENWSDDYHHCFQRAIKEEMDWLSDIPQKLKNWILSIDTSVAIPKHRIMDLFVEEYRVLSFNYTDTLERVYGVPKHCVNHIHGFASTDEQLIIGHHNKSFLVPFERRYDNLDEELIMGFDPRVEEAKSKVYDFMKSLFKNTESIINMNEEFWNQLNSVDEVYVLGHSCTEVDYDYFKTVRARVDDNCRWYFSSFSDKDRANIEMLIDSLRIEVVEDFLF